MDVSLAKSAAQFLYEQHRLRKIFQDIDKPDDCGVDFAYDVQDHFVGAIQGDNKAAIAGYKIGLTTKRMQQMVSIDHPIAGAILSNRIVSSPAALRSGDFVRLGLECEIAVRIATPLDLSAQELNRETVAGAIDQCAAAFEIIEDRQADYSALDVISLIADNSWNAGIVLGPAVNYLDIADLDGILAVNGAENDRGRSSDVLGHPLDAVAWLAAHLEARGTQLQAGQWIMTGSIVPTRFPKPGDIYEFSVANLPSVKASIA